MPRMVSYHRPKSGHITCYLNRTYHVLPTAVSLCLDVTGRLAYRPAQAKNDSKSQIRAYECACIGRSLCRFQPEGMMTMRKAARILALFSILAIVLTAAQAQQEWSLVVRLNRAADEVVPDDAKVEKLAGDFGFLEGPVWIRKSGYLLFSDIPANVIRKFSLEDGKVSTFLKYSGFTGTDSTHVGGQTSNGRA